MMKFYIVDIFLILTAVMVNFWSVTTEQVKLDVKEFQIRKDVNICDEVVFLYENITQDLSCMMKCTQNASCKGVFSDPPNGQCVGCFKARKNNGYGNETRGTYFEDRSSKTELCFPCAIRLQYLTKKSKYTHDCCSYIIYVYHIIIHVFWQS